MTHPPLEIVDQGREAVCNYFASLETAQETYRIREAKLLVVGEGGVGKTTLINALFTPDYTFDINAHLTTEGVDITQHQFPFNDQKGEQQQFTTNIWDFGGQEIYHATHQFFLTRRSLYLFVWEARQEYHDLGFYHWLNTIQLLAAGSPVIVVMNKKSFDDVAITDLLGMVQVPGSPEREQWDVFLSYSRRDFALVQELVIDLQSRGISYWWDEERIQPGDPVSERISDGLRRSRVVVPCLSYAHKASGWSRAEYQSVLHQVISGHSKQTVAPLILDDLPEDEFPQLLTDRAWTRYTDRQAYDRLLRSLAAG